MNRVELRLIFVYMVVKKLGQIERYTYQNLPCSSLRALRLGFPLSCLKIKCLLGLDTLAIAIANHLVHVTIQNVWKGYQGQ